MPLLSYIRYSLLLLLLSVSGSRPGLFTAFFVQEKPEEVNSVRLFRLQDNWVDSVLASLSYEQKLAQLLVPYCRIKDYSTDTITYNKLLSYIRDVGVGGLIVAGGAVQNQIELLNSFQSLAKVPLLISADYERGAGQKQKEGTIFPYLMAFGATGDSLLAYRAASYIAVEARLAGVHQNYSPVADVNSNPDNPIINNRSFGEQTEMVTRLTTAFVKGFQDNGLIATVKHFPGHGNTSLDSHKEPVVLHQSLPVLNKVDLVPFQQAIACGTMSVMTGHLSVPAIDTSRTPASLSGLLTTDLLKRRLGFEGLIVTDALGMHAITTQYQGGEATVRAFLAGNDILLLPDDLITAHQALIMAYKEGRFTNERIDHSVRKILLAKKHAGLAINRQADYEKFIGRKQGAISVAEKVAEKSITLLRNTNGLIPLKPEKLSEIQHIVLSDANNSNAGEDFHKALSQYGKFSLSTFHVKTHKNDYKKFLRQLKSQQTILVSVYTKISSFKGSLGPDGIQTEFIKDILKKSHKVIVLIHGSPYIASLVKSAGAILTNYGETPASETALLKALIGEISCQGTLPVSVPGTAFTVGSGIVQQSETTLLKNSKEINNAPNLDTLILKAIKDSVAPSISALVIKGNTVVYNKAFGRYTYHSDSYRTDSSSLYDLASVSKVIATTTAVMICVDRKLFSLDDKVIQYLPDFGNAGKSHITIRHLLLHNSGLPAFKQYYKLINTADELVNDIFMTPPEFKSGEKTVYSDLGMITVGKIIEKVTGTSLDNFCRDEIFIPLGMYNTMYAPPFNLKERCVPTEIDSYWRKRLLQGEVHDEAASMLNGVAGHAGLFSTANDLAVLLFTLLNKGIYNGKRLVSENTVSYFIKRQSESSSRAIGWDTKTDEKSSSGKNFSLSSYGHTGYTGTSVWSDPESGLIVVLLTNRVHPTRNNTRLGKFRPTFHDAVYTTFIK